VVQKTHDTVLIDSTFKIPEINVFMEIDFRHKISKIILVIYLFIYLFTF